MDSNHTPQPSIPPEEQVYLQKILHMVDEELVEAERSVEEMDEEYRQIQQYMADNRGEDNTRDMFQSQQLLGQIDSQGVSAVLYRDRLKKTKLSPYFARIDFRPQGETDIASYYIGLYAFRFQRQLYIIDWRSPVASMFYDFELGPAYYTAPQGRTDGELTRKRQFKITAGQMEYAFDSSQNIQDDILQQELAHTGDREDEVHHLHHPEGAKPDYPGREGQGDDHSGGGRARARPASPCTGWPSSCTGTGTPLRPRT